MHWNTNDYKESLHIYKAIQINYIEVFGPICNHQFRLHQDDTNEMKNQF